MTETLEKLKAGIRTFQTDVHGPKAEEYRKAASEPQRPHTLVIACADSRVDVETSTSAGPGDVFVARNIGNMVPTYGSTAAGVSAVIEYAVNHLKVRHIAVCGHSDCGAMKALLNPDSIAGLPMIRGWLTCGETALAVAPILQDRDGRDLLTVLTEQNVLSQLAHLKTHPSVAGAMAKEILTVSGWVYDIGSGEVRIAEDEAGRFVPVTETGSGVAM